MQMVGHGVASLGPFHTLRPNWAIRPRVRFLYLADHSGLNQFHQSHVARSAVPLISHLCDDAMFLGNQPHLPSLIERVR